MSSMAESVHPVAGSVSQERVLVLDFGAQYAQLIARRVREQNVYCELVRHDITPEQIKQHAPLGLILSGGNIDIQSGNDMNIVGICVSYWSRHIDLSQNL